MPDIAVSADDLESSLQKKEGVLILDLRPKEKFMEGHIPTSASVAAESPQQKQVMLSKVPAAFKIILADDGLGETEQFAQELYDTLHNKILTLPADAKIFPTHHGEGVKPTENGIYYTTVEMAKKLPLLDISKEEFVKKVVSITTPRPMNYGMVIKVNKGIIPPNPMMIPDLEMGPNRCSVQ